MRPAILVTLALLAAGCALPTAPTLSIADRVATSVSGTLTAEPLPSPEALPSDTPPPSATVAVTPIEPTATPTETATATISPTTTAVAGDPRTTLGQPAWRDELNSGSGWNLGNDSFTKVEIDDGKLVMTGLTSTDGWRITWPEVDNAYIEATVRTRACQGNDHYGLIFRVPDLHSPTAGYLFGFTCDGRYWLRTWDGEKMETLIGLTTASAIQAGSNKTNRIGVLADGERLGLYANGTLLGEFEDDTFAEKGGFGLFIGARKTDGFTTETEEIGYWNLP